MRIQFSSDADKRGTQQALAHAVAAAHFLNHLMIGHVAALHHFQSLVHPRIKNRTHGLDRLHADPAQHFLHLLHDQFHPGAQLLGRAGRLQRQLKVVQHRQELFDGIRNSILARLGALLRLALAGVVELSLEAEQAIPQLIFLGPEPVVFLLRNGCGLDGHERLTGLGAVPLILFCRLGVLGGGIFFFHHVSAHTSILDDSRGVSGMPRG